MSKGVPMLATNQVPSLRLTLRAQTAVELMRESPVSLRADATLPEALALFADKGLTVAPVIDEARKPIGVLSCPDILVHEHERMLPGQPHPPAAGTDRARVRDMMTPAV